MLALPSCAIVGDPTLTVERPKPPNGASRSSALTIVVSARAMQEARPIVLKNPLLHVVERVGEKSASQIALYAARDHRLGVREPMKTSLKSFPGSFSTQ